MNSQNACILQVEDEEIDVLLLQRAFKGAQLSNPVRVVNDGQEAIDYLSRAAHESESQAYPMPCLILLDLNMPVKSGLEVLRWVRQQPRLSGLPVIVFTSSEDPTDILCAYKWGANSFVVKPVDPEERIRLAQGLKIWWIESNVRPEITESPAPVP